MLEEIRENARGWYDDNVAPFLEKLDEDFFNGEAGEAIRFLFRGEYPEAAKEEICERERQARRFYRMARERGRQVSDLEDEVERVRRGKEELGEALRESRTRVVELGGEIESYGDSLGRVSDAYEEAEKALARAREKELNVEAQGLYNRAIQTREVQKRDYPYAILWVEEGEEEMDISMMNSNRLARDALEGTDLFSGDGKAIGEAREKLKREIRALDEKFINSKHELEIEGTKFKLGYYERGSSSQHQVKRRKSSGNPYSLEIRGD